MLMIFWSLIMEFFAVDCRDGMMVIPLGFFPGGIRGESQIEFFYGLREGASKSNLSRGMASSLGMGKQGLMGQRTPWVEHQFSVRGLFIYARCDYV